MAKQARETKPAAEPTPEAPAPAPTPEPTPTAEAAPTPEAPPPPPDPAPPLPATQARSGGAENRVVCTISTDTNIDGCAYATIQDGEKQLHVSAQMAPDKAVRLCSIPGFSLFKGTDEQAALIDDAIVAAKQAEADVARDTGAYISPDAELVRVNEELLGNNKRLAADVQHLRRLNDTQAKTIETLEKENRGLKKGGASAANPISE